MDAVKIVRHKRMNKDEEFEIVDGTYSLGTYSSEEKAQKVLDQIQEMYMNHMYEPPRAAVYGYRTSFAFNQPKVYQMPEEKDV